MRILNWSLLKFFKVHRLLYLDSPTSSKHVCTTYLSIPQTLCQYHGRAHTTHGGRINEDASVNLHDIFERLTKIGMAEDTALQEITESGGHGSFLQENRHEIEYHFPCKLTMQKLVKKFPDINRRLAMIPPKNHNLRRAPDNNPLSKTVPWIYRYSNIFRTLKGATCRRLNTEELVHESLQGAIRRVIVAPGCTRIGLLFTISESPQTPQIWVWRETRFTDGKVEDVLEGFSLLEGTFQRDLDVHAGMTNELGHLYLGERDPGVRFWAANILELIQRSTDRAYLDVEYHMKEVIQAGGRFRHQDFHFIDDLNYRTPECAAACLKEPSAHELKRLVEDSKDETTEEDAAEPECAICIQPLQFDQDSADRPVKLDCNHIFGSDCIQKWLAQDKDDAAKPSCPICRYAIDVPIFMELHPDLVPSNEPWDTLELEFRDLDEVTGLHNSTSPIRIDDPAKFLMALVNLLIVAMKTSPIVCPRRFNPVYAYETVSMVTALVHWIPQMHDPYFPCTLKIVLLRYISAQIAADAGRPFESVAMELIQSRSLEPWFAWAEQMAWRAVALYTLDRGEWPDFRMGKEVWGELWEGVEGRWPVLVRTIRELRGDSIDGKDEDGDDEEDEMWMWMEV